MQKYLKYLHQRNAVSIIQLHTRSQTVHFVDRESGYNNERCHSSVILYYHLELLFLFKNIIYFVIYLRSLISQPEIKDSFSKAPWYISGYFAFLLWSRPFSKWSMWIHQLVLELLQSSVYIIFLTCIRPLQIFNIIQPFLEAAYCQSSLCHYSSFESDVCIESFKSS